MISRFYSCLIYFLILTACTPAVMVSSKKIVTTAEPIQDLTIAISMGNLSAAGVSNSDQYAFENALKTRFKDIFIKNGVAVKKLIVASPNQSDDDFYPKTLVEDAKTSHVLLAKATSLVQENQFRYISYKVSLLDVKNKSVVWSGVSKLTLFSSQPLLRTQNFAGEILNGLQKDGFIHMNQERSLDLNGEEITAGYYINSQDR